MSVQASYVSRRRTQQVAVAKKVTSPKQLLWLAILLLVLVASAFLVIYARDGHRDLFVDYQRALAKREAIRVESDRLALEQSTWATQVRIQTMAQHRLGMEVPAPRAIKMIRQ